jgi:hypothetical protein
VSGAFEILKTTENQNAKKKQNTLFMLKRCLLGKLIYPTYPTLLEILLQNQAIWKSQ